MSHPYTPYMPSFFHQVTSLLLLPYYSRTIPVQFPYNSRTIAVQLSTPDRHKTVSLPYFFAHALAYVKNLYYLCTRFPSVECKTDLVLSSSGLGQRPLTP